MIHRFLSALGAAIALFSLFFCMAAIGDLLEPEHTETPFGVLVGLLVFFLGSMIGGIYLGWTQHRRARTGKAERTERTILRMIAARNGRITPEEIALELPLTVGQARERLDALCEDGSGEVQVTMEGKKVYVFFGFPSDEDRNSARSVLD
jgi:hypothetical protein